MADVKKFPNPPEDYDNSLNSQYIYCKFCGQSFLANVRGMTVEEIDEAATAKCECEDAKRYTYCRKTISQARSKLEELAGQGCEKLGLEPLMTISIKEFLHKAVDLLTEERILQLTVTFGESKLSLKTGDKGIGITRTDTTKIQR